MNCYEEGIRAYRYGLNWEACPYLPGTVAWEEWVDGWEDAEDWDI